MGVFGGCADSEGEAVKLWEAGVAISSSELRDKGGEKKSSEERGDGIDTAWKKSFAIVEDLGSSILPLTSEGDWWVELIPSFE